MALPLVLLAVVIVGCDKEYGLQFSHNLHVVELELECADCHGEKTEDGQHKEIDHSTCADCHEDEIDADEAKEDTCGYCHKLRSIEELEDWEAPPKHAPRGVFVHRESTADKCQFCHADMMREKFNKVPEMSRPDIVRMRDLAHGLGMECAECHGPGIRKDIEPADHAKNWTKRHGLAGRQEDSACLVCHTDDGCRECHLVNKPDWHNTLWRTRTHGIQASWDRERCQVCHEEDSCRLCHEETRPRSHTAAWGQQHCFNCHTDTAGGTGCALCHDSGFGSHPDPHPVGWQSRHCDSCHPGSPQAEQCALCHDTTISSHPNPHSSGWRNRHCNNCHSGSSLSGECSLCHENGDSVSVHQGTWPSQHDLFPSNIPCDFCHM